MAVFGLEGTGPRRWVAFLHGLFMTLLITTALAAVVALVVVLLWVSGDLPEWVPLPEWMSGTG